MASREKSTWGRLGLAVLAAGLLGATGCSAKKKNDTAPTGVSPSAFVGKALATLEAVRDAYETQDMERVLGYFDREYYPDLSRLRRALYEDREKIAQVRLEFHIDQELAGSSGSDLITARWNRGWTDITTGTPMVASGRAEFQFGSDGAVKDMRPVNGGLPLGFH